MDSNQPPELLERKDFISPLLYKIYKYLRIIYRLGISSSPITSYFTNNELKTIVDNLRNCNSDFREKYDSGYCENISLRDSENMLNKVHRGFQPSYTQKILNKTEKFITSSNKATQGEINVLECIFYRYAETVFYPTDESEIGYWDNDGLTVSFKKKELQLATMNSLFCNIGNRIQSQYINTAKDALVELNKKYNSENSIINPIGQHILEYAGIPLDGGKLKKTKINKKNTKRRKQNKYKKTIKQNKSKKQRK